LFGLELEADLTYMFEQVLKVNSSYGQVVS